jgi:hypothetical protein
LIKKRGCEKTCSIYKIEDINQTYANIIIRIYSKEKGKALKINIRGVEYTDSQLSQLMDMDILKQLQKLISKNLYLIFPFIMVNECGGKE